jgi:hypothetical protein
MFSSEIIKKFHGSYKWDIIIESNIDMYELLLQDDLDFKTDCDKYEFEIFENGIYDGVPNTYILIFYMYNLQNKLLYINLGGHYSIIEGKTDIPNHDILENEELFDKFIRLFKDKFIGGKTKNVILNCYVSNYKKIKVDFSETKKRDKFKEIKRIIRNVYVQPQLGKGYCDYAQKCKLSLFDTRNTNRNIILEHKKIIKEYYLMAINLGYKKAMKPLAMAYSNDGDYDNLLELKKIANSRKIEKMDILEKYFNLALFKCSCVAKNTKNVEMYFSNISNKIHQNYFELGTYYKKIKDDVNAIINYKISEKMGSMLANYVIGSYFVSKGDQKNAKFFFDKLFTDENTHNICKIKVIQYFIVNNRHNYAENILKKELKKNYSFQLVKNNFLKRITEKHIVQCSYLLSKIYQHKNMFKESDKIITDLYNQMMLNDKLLGIKVNHWIKITKKGILQTTCKINSLSNIYSLIWFEYTILDYKNHKLFCQYSVLQKKIDKWIKKREIHYMSVEDISVN